MRSLGIEARLRRLQGPQGRMLLLALDHGLPAGPLPGIENPTAFLRGVRGAPLTGLIVNPGFVRFLAEELPSRSGLVIHLSAGTLLGSRPTTKVVATSVERAVALGADAVSVQIHFGGPAEDRMVSDAGDAVDTAAGFGLPVLAMVHPPRSEGGGLDPAAVRHAVRTAAEMGARLVQTPYAGASETFREVVRGCPVPVLVSGGPAAPSPDVWLSMVHDAIAAGAAGVAAGRNLFQHPNPRALVVRLGDTVFGANGKAVPVGG